MEGDTVKGAEVIAWQLGSSGVAVVEVQERFAEWCFNSTRSMGHAATDGSDIVKGTEVIAWQLGSSGVAVGEVLERFVEGCVGTVGKEDVNGEDGSYFVGATEFFGSGGSLEHNEQTHHRVTIMMLQLSLVPLLQFHGNLGSLLSGRQAVVGA